MIDVTALRRFLEETEPAGVSELSFPNLIRLGFERGLLAQSWDFWNDIRDARNATSHGYDEAKARKLAAKIPDFAAASRYLLGQIETRQA